MCMGRWWHQEEHLAKIAPKYHLTHGHVCQSAPCNRHHILVVGDSSVELKVCDYTVDKLHG